MKPDCNEVEDSNGSGGVCYGVSSASGVSEVDMEGIGVVFIGFMWIMVSVMTRSQPLHMDVPHLHTDLFKDLRLSAQPPIT